jgi:L-fuculose-phosphate aldolase
VANHDGNITARLDKNHVLATPTAFAKNEIQEDDLVVVDLWKGDVVRGKNKVFSEISLHLEYYRVRSDVGAVVHAHPPCSSGFSIAGIEVETRLTPEAIVSLGDRIPLAPLVKPGSLASRQQVRTLGAVYDAIMLANHGSLACGVDVEQAYLRTELVEHLALMQQQAMVLGSVRLVQPELVIELMAKRRRAGLGPEARNAPAPSPQALSELPVEQIISAMVEELKTD